MCCINTKAFRDHNLDHTTKPDAQSRQIAKIPNEINKKQIVCDLWRKEMKGLSIDRFPSSLTEDSAAQWK